jgi:serine/threonine-protein kinase HipA
MMKIWADGLEAGLLDRHGRRGSSFAYLPDAAPERAVSVTMPVRLASWNAEFGLAPIFEMNLPEGVLRERLRLAFAKATGSFDEFDLLAIVGRSQIGRLRYTGRDDRLDEGVPFQSVDEILAARREGDLFRHLIERFAAFSGISGVQPKVLIRDAPAARAFGKDEGGFARSFRGATHIVKFWDRSDYPELAANEFFCLKAAQRCGLEVPPFRLAEDGAALVVDRFDLRPDGSYRGVEDFCVLNARRTEEKYRGSYETAVMKRLADYVDTADLPAENEKLFTLIALNCALRNGDAHLKNFAIVYERVLAQARLAPVYDLVTTSVYLPQDNMALTLDGTTRWPDARRLRRLGETRLTGTPARVRDILARIADAMAETMGEIRAYRSEHPAFAEIGERMMQQWEEGMHGSLKEA